MANKAFSALAAVAASVLLSFSPVFAASLSMASPDWAIYTGSGSVTSAVESSPLIGSNVNVLNVTTQDGVNFGIMQRGVTPFPVADARFVRIVARSSEPFMVYFLARSAGDNQQQYLQYYSGKSFRAYQSAYPYVMAPYAKFGGTEGQWTEIWLDLQSDLNVMRPGMTISQIEWVAVRGNLSIASIEFYARADLPLAQTDTDEDGLSNTDELDVALTNIYRNDSDADSVGDKLEHEAVGACAHSLDVGLPTLQDLDQNGVNNRDAVLMGSACADAVMPMLRPQGWRVYANPGDGIVTVDSQGLSATMAHSRADPLAMGIFNTSLAEPYPSLRIERDQLDIRFTPTNAGEGFYIFVLVQGSDDKRYYLSFPRAGTERAVSNAGWVTYLITPLEAFYGYEFSAAAPVGGFSLYLDLTAALQAFFPALHVKSILWTAVRGRLTLHQISYPPEVRLPVTEVSSGAAFTLDAHGPALPFGQNNGTLCRAGVDACSEYLWSAATPSGPTVSFVSGLNGTQVSMVAPAVTLPTEVTLKLRVRQTTAHRSAGIWTEGTTQVLVRPPPTISNVLPAAATGGDHITITGSHFLTGGTVSIGGVAASVESWSPTVIVAVVPEEAPPGAIDVIVSAGGDPSTPAALAIYPTLVSVSESSASAGTLLTIAATNLGNVEGFVRVGGSLAEVLSWSMFEVAFRLPADAPPGVQPVSVESGGGQSNSVGFIVVPAIELMTPDAGVVNSTARIQGSNFGSPGAVFFGTTPATVSLWAADVIDVVVPNLPGGTHAVAVEVAGQTAGGISYRITPSISSVSPNEATADTIVTVIGSGFGVGLGTITLGGAGAAIQSWTDTSITFAVPSSWNPGAGSLSVSPNGGDVVAVAFTVKPSIHTITPATGSGGTIVTVSGRNLGAAAGMVRIQSTAIVPSSWSPNSVTLVIPDSIPAGNHALALETAGMTTNSLPITVMPSISSISPATAQFGTLVTINGRNFGSLQGAGALSLSGLTIESWAPTSIQFRVSREASGGAELVAVNQNGQASNAVPLFIHPTIFSARPVVLPTYLFPVTGANFDRYNSEFLLDGAPICGTNGIYAENAELATCESVGPGVKTLQVKTDGVISPSSVTTYVTPGPWILLATDWSYSCLWLVGEQFGSTGSLFVGGTSVTPTSWSNEYVEACLPDALAAGTYPLQIRKPVLSSSGTSSQNFSTSVPKTNNDVGTVESTLLVSNVVGEVSGIEVTVNVTHPWTSDLEISVVHPDGTSVLLHYRAYGTNVVTTYPTLTQPSGNLSQLISKNAAGTWRLRVYDWASGSSATINSWSLKFTTPGSTQAIYMDSNAKSIPGGSAISTYDLDVWGTYGEITDLDVSVNASYISQSQLGIRLCGGSDGLDMGTCTNLHWFSGSGTSINTTYDSATAPYESLTNRNGLNANGKYSLVINNLSGSAGTLNSWSVRVRTSGGWLAGGNSNLVNFMLRPLISSVPASAWPGANVTITGNHFGASQGANSVRIGNSAMTVQSWTNNSITAIVPSTYAGASTVYAVVNGLASNTLSTQVVPHIDSATPLTVSGGASLTIDGSNLGASGSVSLGGTPLTVTSWSPNRIVASISNYMWAGTHTLTVTPLGLPTPNTMSITVVPYIAGLTGNGAIGSSLTITGTNFGASQGPGGVTIGGLQAAVSSWSSTTIVVTIPSTIVAGTKNVFVTAGQTGNTKVSAAKALAVFPTLTTLSVASGVGSASITLTGNGFGASKGASSVSFGATLAATTTWSNTSIVTVVPNAVGPGIRPVVVKVGGLDSSALNFTVHPNLISFTPNRGAVGDGFAVTGTNLGTPRGANDHLLFGSTNAEISAWGQTSISAIVPPLPVGVYSVTAVAGGEVSNALAFAVSATATSISPAAGAAGTVVMISGGGFGTSQGASEVTFSGMPAVVYAWSDSQILVEAPDTVTAGALQVVIRVNGADSASLTFQLAPGIVGVSPTSTTAGAPIVISGDSFGATKGTSSVHIGGVVATTTAWSMTSITALLPPTAAPGSVGVRVSVGGVASQAAEITALPSLASVSPNKGRSGAAISIAGANLGASQGGSRLYFGGVAVTPTAWSSTSVQSAAPTGLGPGIYELSASVTAMTTNPVTYSVVPEISTVVPRTHAVGSPFIIRGVDFGAIPGTVRSGSVSLTILDWSPTAITAVAGESAGMFTIHIETNGTTSNAASATVRPYVASVTPETGGANDELLIEGRGFGSAKGGSTVSIGGVTAGIDAWSDTLITARVPMLAPAGVVDLTVRVSGIDSESVAFERRRPWIDERFPPATTVGTEVTLTGRYFGSVPGTVFMGGVTAVTTGWTASTIQFEVPSGVPGGPQPVFVDVGGETSNVMLITQRGSDVWVIEDEPSPRGAAAAVWTGTEMIVWGGLTASSRLSSGVRYNPATDSWVGMNPRGSPVGRSDHTVVWTGRDVIVWGGRDLGGAYLLSGARYSPDADSWSPISATGAPAGRYLHSAVWTGAEMLIWGGLNSTRLNSGARYNPETDSWQSSALTGAPAARAEHSAVWTGSEVIVWGGLTDTYPYYSNTGARYQPVLDTWAPTTVLGAPTARYGHSAVWTGADMLVWGGKGSTVTNTGGSYNPLTNTWTSLTTANAPEARSNHQAIWTGVEMIVWGGGSSLASGGRFNPELNAWTPMSTIGAVGRVYHHTAWTGKEMIIFGGQNAAANNLNTGARYNVAFDSWSPISVSRQPSPRSGIAMEWTGSEALIWGGVGSGGYATLGFRYSPATDTWLALSTLNAPSPRSEALNAMAGGKWVVWGGDQGGGGIYDPSIDTWAPMPATGAPIQRYDTRMVSLGNEVFFWGGRYGGSTFSDGARFNAVTGNWTSVQTTNAPTARHGHVVVSSPDRILIWGGYQSTALNTGAFYYPESNTWATLSTVGAPTARSLAIGGWVAGQWLIWGGRNSASVALGTGGKFIAATNSWTTMSVTGAPSPRFYHVGGIDSSHLFVYGGTTAQPGAILADGARYNPVSDTWAPVTALGAPAGRMLPGAVWTGDEWLIFGGRNWTPKYLSDLGRYIP